MSDTPSPAPATESQPAAPAGQQPAGPAPGVPSPTGDGGAGPASASDKPADPKPPAASMDEMAKTMQMMREMADFQQQMQAQAQAQVQQPAGFTQEQVDALVQAAVDKAMAAVPGAAVDSGQPAADQQAAGTPAQGDAVAAVKQLASGIAPDKVQLDSTHNVFASFDSWGETEESRQKAAELQAVMDHIQSGLSSLEVDQMFNKWWYEVVNPWLLKNPSGQSQAKITRDIKSLG